jgi:hypothetical protein
MAADAFISPPDWHVRMCMYAEWMDQMEKLLLYIQTARQDYLSIEIISQASRDTHMSISLVGRGSVFPGPRNLNPVISCVWPK